MRTARSIVFILIALFIGGCGAGKSGSAAKSPAEHPEATPAILPAAQAHAYLGDHPEALILDVREPAEWDDDVGHIEGARQIPLGLLVARLGEIEDWKDKPVIVVSRGGERSQAAAETLHAGEFKLVIILDGGMKAWRAARY